MTAPGTHAIWCHTCGAYIHPGSHGIHVPSYGSGPREDSPDDGIGGAGAVALVVSTILGLALVALAIGVALSRLGS